MESPDKQEEVSENELYRIYEFSDGLYFPDEHFQCGSIRNYIETGILTEAEAERIWNENVAVR